ncbi:MAG: hypothetical protein ACI977_000039 [Candidatus Nanohaloarchaea archaeon]|jgi:hypothetical protein
MDKTLEIVIAVVVLMATAVVLLFMLQGESDSFSGFLEDRSNNASCQLLKAEYENGDTAAKDEAPSECNTASWEDPG